MDPCRRCLRLRDSRIPRTRGDGPGAARSRGRGGPDSPHTAGMDLVYGIAATVTVRIPRTRGDGPAHIPPESVEIVDSPHTRGWTRLDDGPAPHVLGFPAHAGMDPAGPTARRPATGIPRTRGDGPALRVRQAIEAVDSPHTRGWTPAPRGEGDEREGFPAHAGMDPGQGSPPRAWPGIPRTRGDGPCRRCGGVLEHPGFPAHAGMDPTQSSRPDAIMGIPRTRGDGPRAIW